MKRLFFLATVISILSFGSLASAQGIAAWEASATSAGAGFIAKDISAPTQMDIGEYALDTGGGVTYEFVFNADVRGASSAFMGSLSAPAGDSAGLKFDQWNNTGTYGATAFGVADYTSGVAHAVNTDAHAVFVADGTNIDLYVNGAFAETMADASFALSGITGLGHAYNHGNEGSVDPLNGTLLGVAVYDSALSADAIQANFDAFVPEPNASLMSVMALAGLLAAARRRR